MNDPFRFKIDNYIEEVKRRFPERKAKKIIKNYLRALYGRSSVGEEFTIQERDKKM